MVTTAAALPRPDGDGAIDVQQLRHVYSGGKVALDGIDLHCGTGLFGLLGPNGAGKSTLMRILCTLLVPTAGRATVGGHDVVRERLAVRRQIGYLPQSFGAWRLQRVEEVVDTLARLGGLRDRKTRLARVRACLEQVGLADVADRKVKKLSGGMLRRLGVAQALVHEPRFLIVDEPTVGLDPQERLRFRQLMTSLGQEHTILLSTHIVADLGSGCSDLALIDGGKIQFRGSPAALVQHAHGKVFELNVPMGTEPQLRPGQEIVSRTRTAVGTKVRAVAADGAFPPGAQPAEQATLEEGYLAFMAARGRAEAAVVEEEAS
ncbi:MAG TPA: ATP-binding cassette domain-containing protein [Candidatus Polarisedimenticolaceae bacterium]|nr:ATP-binding cassette domain-containing protein [Candidatus Polarisedimenticolaceae bacterium]